MPGLILNDIHKTYRAGNTSVEALKGVSLAFRENEFVAVLGPSGCGKTTLLNVIGGLDRYDGGDLLISGVSTKSYKDADWDAYRNNSIGFVFQSYNLISHTTVLQNVEMTLTLSGVSPRQRRQRAKEALEKVGLGDQLRKKPNQLSGGQMQRVAIARALVNDPDIIMADEPTGSLDSGTSVQVMELLKEVAETKLVIMVTHNPGLAGKYATRTISLLDGNITDDSNPVTAEELAEAPPAAAPSQKKAKQPNTSMSMPTALGLSLRNLLTKKGRTIITAFAGSIGIIGVALVLSLANGLNGYMGTMQTTTLAGFPVTVTVGDTGMSVGAAMNNNPPDDQKDPAGDVLIPYDPYADASGDSHFNIFTSDYLNYVNNAGAALPGSVNTVAYTYGLTMNLLVKSGDAVLKFDTRPRAGVGALLSGGGWQELPDNNDFILSQYDLIGSGSRLPEAKNEIALVVDDYNRVEKSFLTKLGVSAGGDLKLSDFIGKTLMTAVPNDDFYTESGGLFAAKTPADYPSLYTDPNGIQLTVTGILRAKPDNPSGSGFLQGGFVYTSALTSWMVDNAQNSKIAAAQKASENNVLTGAPLNDDTRDAVMKAMGADVVPTSINIYPKDFGAKEKIKAYLDAYNDGKSDADKVTYMDLAQTITDFTSKLVNIVSAVLAGFAAISLVVSTVMIAIITYISVLERTKEIGILRSIGARKKDIRRLFNAETLIIGLVAGLIGIGITVLLCIPINIIIQNVAQISGIARLNPLHGILLIAGSMALTLIAGLIPASMAGRKDPVAALRTE